MFDESATKVLVFHVGRPPYSSGNVDANMYIMYIPLEYGEQTIYMEISNPKISHWVKYLILR